MSTLNPMQKIASNGRLVNLGLMNDPTIPEGYQDRAAQLYRTAADSYNTGSFHARHPIVSGGLNALIGVLSGNPAGLVTGPLAGNQQEEDRKNAVVKAYQQGLAALADQQSKLNDTQTAATRGHGLNTLAANAGYESPFGDYAQIDPTTFKNTLDSIMAGDTAQGALGMQQGAFKQGWNIGGRMYNDQQALGNGQRVYNNAPAEPTQSGQPYIAAGAQEQGSTPLRPAIYQNPDIVKAGLDNSSKLFEAGLKTFPDYAKLPGEVAKLVSEGKANEALALLRNAQTTTEQERPALIRAETTANQALGSLRDRTDPNLRASNVIDLMTPAQRAEYAGNTAAGKIGQYNPTQALTEYQLDTIMNSDKDANGKPISPAAKQAAAAAFQRLRSNGRGSRAAAPLPASRPSVHGIPIE